MPVLSAFHPGISPDLWWAGIAMLGLVVGVIAGMFGVGGGFLLTPMLNVIFGVRMDLAIGAGLCQMIGTATAAFRRHRRLRQGEIKIDWIMMAGTLIGVQLGAQAVQALSRAGTIHALGHTVPAAQFWLSVTYVALLTTVGLWMLHDARIHRGEQLERAGPIARLKWPPLTYLPRCGHYVPTLLLVTIGVAMGFLSGLIGIGGGVVLMPVLIYSIGMRVQTAAGTGILLLLATCVAGTTIYAIHGKVNLALAMVLLVGGATGAPIGATLTSQIPGHRLRGVFAVIVFLSAAAVLWNLLSARSVTG